MAADPSVAPSRFRNTSCSNNNNNRGAPVTNNRDLRPTPLVEDTEDNHSRAILANNNSRNNNKEEEADIRRQDVRPTNLAIPLPDSSP